MPRIKTSVLALACTLAPALYLESARTVEVDQPVPRVEVEVEPEIESLANGFAAAFEALPKGARYVVAKTPDGERYLGAARSVKAFDGVLRIELDSGVVHVLNARDLARITNEPPGGARK